MPRFYFDIIGKDTDLDSQGSIYPDRDSAELAAVRMALDIAACEIPGNINLIPKVVLRNDAGMKIYTVFVELHTETST